MLRILLVEDNEGDILLTTEALENLHFEKEIDVARTGKEAIEFLSKTGNYAESPTPDLVLLDINLPIKNGVEVLRFIRSQADISGLPVIILTTSSSPSDKEAVNSLHANMFISKPLDMYEYEKIISNIEEFWIEYTKQHGITT